MDYLISHFLWNGILWHPIPEKPAYHLKSVKRRKTRATRQHETIAGVPYLVCGESTCNLGRGSWTYLDAKTELIKLDDISSGVCTSERTILSRSLCNSCNVTFASTKWVCYTHGMFEKGICCSRLGA